MRLFDELAVRAEIHGQPIVAGIAEVAPGLRQRSRPRRIGGPAAVVADDGDDRDVVADGGVDVHRVDAERAVAVQHQHLGVGLRELGTDAVGQPYAHRAKGAGVESVTGGVGRDGLAAEVQDLLAVDDEDRVALEEVANLFAETQRVHRQLVPAHRLVLLGAFLGVERPQLARPRSVPLGIDLAVGLGAQLLEHGPGVARDRHVDRAVVPELGRIDVDVDHLHVGGEARRPSELDHPVEARADGQHAIILAHVRIEEDWVASGINDFTAPRRAVTIRDTVKHPGRRSNHSICAGQAIQDCLAIPAERMRRSWGTVMNGLSPGDQIPVRHHNARDIDRQIAITKMIEMQNVRPEFADQRDQKG